VLFHAEVKASKRGFSRSACGGRTTQPEIPTMRSCRPSKYSLSTASSVTIRLDGKHPTLAYPIGQTPALPDSCELRDGANSKKLSSFGPLLDALKSQTS